MSQTTKKLESFFWFYLILNPILDIVSGLYIQFVTKGDVYSSASIAPITPSLVVRMVVLLVMVGYIFLIRDWKSVKIAIPMGVAWLMSVASEFITFGGVSIFIDIQYFSRFAYNVAVFFVYCRLMERSGLPREQVIEKIHQFIMASLFLLTVVIVVPYIFGAGHYTYADRFGYRGFRGFYYSGNDITGALMILFPIGSCYFLSIPARDMNRKRMALLALPLAMTLLSMLMIGTKTAFLAIGVSIFGIVVYALVQLAHKDPEAFKRVICVAILFVLLFAVISGLSMLVSGTSIGDTLEGTIRGFGDAKGESAETLLFSGRLKKLMPSWNDYTGGGPLTWLFGVGRGSQVETIEMDLCETLIYYGIFGFIAMLWLFFKEGVAFVGRFFRQFSVLGLGAFLSLGLCVGYLTIAGHVLFTVTSGFYFAVTLAYARFITGGDLQKR